MLVAAFALAGCRTSDDIAPEPTPAGAAPAFECGALTPGLTATCNQSGDALGTKKLDEDQTSVDLGDGPYSGSVSWTREECGPRDREPPMAYNPEWSRIEVVAASLAASCEVQPEGEGLAATVRFVGAGSQFCDRSASLVAPTWQGTIRIPAGMHRVRVESEAELDLESWGDPDHAGCIAYVDGEPADPIFQGKGRLATRYVSGPAEVPVGLTCPRLAGRSCYGVSNEEGSTRRYVGLTYRVERVE